MKYQRNLIVCFGCSYDSKPSLITALILGLRPASEGQRYFVTASLIGGAQA